MAASVLLVATFSPVSTTVIVGNWFLTMAAQLLEQAGSATRTSPNWPPYMESVFAKLAMSKLDEWIADMLGSNASALAVLRADRNSPTCL